MAMAILGGVLVVGCSTAPSDGGDGTTDDATGTSDTTDTTDTGDDDAGTGDDDAGTGDDDAGTGDTGTDDTGDTGDDTGTTGEPECPPNTGVRPSAISEHFGVFDPVKERMIFYGGNPEFPVQCQGKNAYVGQTWAYYPRCEVWTTIGDDSSGPGARGRAVAVYDSKNHGMYVYGGRFRPKGAPGTDPYTMFDDTWRLDLVTDTWSQVTTTGAAPEARILSGGIYDPKANAMLVFGGSTANTGLNFFPQNDVWKLDLATSEWTLLQTTNPPTKRQYHAAVYDPVAHAMIISGGGDENAFFGPFMGDTWSLDLESLEWTLLNSGGIGAPDRRIWSRLAYSPTLDRVVLFGGHDDGALGNRNDLWLFDIRNGAWELVALNDQFNKPGNGFCDFPKDFATIAEGTPERRGSHLLQYWEAEDSILIHGGKTDCGLIDDVWLLKLDGYEWTDLEPASIGEACERYSEECTSHCG